jgi:hypothetical protein
MTQMQLALGDGVRSSGPTAEPAKRRNDRQTKCDVSKTDVTDDQKEKR